MSNLQPPKTLYSPHLLLEGLYDGGDPSGCSLRGYVQTTANKLSMILGEPTAYDDKIHHSWYRRLLMPSGEIVTFYVYSYKHRWGTPKDRAFQWHVGAKSREIVDYVTNLLITHIRKLPSA